MKPALSPPHGTGLGTTAGITAVISVVSAVSILGQCHGVQGLGSVLGASAAACFIAAAALLYAGRNLIGQALDLAATDPAASGVTAARGLTFFHLGMAAIFAGSGFAACFCLYPLDRLIIVLAPIAGFVAVGVATGNAAGWWREARRRRAKVPVDGP